MKHALVIMINFTVFQKIINLKAANAGLVKKEAAVVAAMEDVTLPRNRMEEDARNDLQAKDVALAELNRRLLEVEAEAKAERAQADAQSACAEAEKTKADVESARAVKAKENYERVLAQHTASSGQLEDAKAMNADLYADRQWMRDYGVVYVGAAVAALRAMARDAGYKAAYTKCLNHVNVVSDKKFTDEQCRAREVDAEGEVKAASQAYNTLFLPILAQVEECLAANDYVDRLRDLFKPETRLLFRPL
ncbi:hypothetical protein HanPI659440_Chr06g0240191 [Helianthus annuus]|nr:hypothetical protein HanPI659440_Chr06g0240191 [Helianthus annuus]